VRGPGRGVGNPERWLENCFTASTMNRRVAALLPAIAILGACAPMLNAQETHAGRTIPEFTVQDLGGRPIQYSTAGSVTVVVFISVRCPMSNAFNARMNSLYNAFAGRVRFVFVNSNANESTLEVRRHAETMGYDFPVYQDAANTVADLLGATSTPDSFVIDRTGLVQYHGYIEDAPNPDRVKDRGLRLAIDAVLGGKPVARRETHSLGCSIRRAKRPGA
jgi:hypothetical protein